MLGQCRKHCPNIKTMLGKYQVSVQCPEPVKWEVHFADPLSGCYTVAGPRPLGCCPQTPFRGFACFICKSACRLLSRALMYPINITTGKITNVFITLERCSQTSAKVFTALLLSYTEVVCHPIPLWWYRPTRFIILTTSEEGWTSTAANIVDHNTARTIGCNVEKNSQRVHFFFRIYA